MSSHPDNGAVRATTTTENPPRRALLGGSTAALAAHLDSGAACPSYIPTPMVFNRETRMLRDGFNHAQLSRQEAVIFRLLADRRPHVVPPEAIVNQIWDGDGPEDGIRAIDISLCRLRRRLQKAGIRDCIARILGEGLCLTVPVEVMPPADRQVVFEGQAITRLRELLRRCADRPADAGLAEQIRAAAVWG